jgi:hypothetical protein
MSRSDALGFVAGTTAMAILPSWARPSWALGAAPVPPPDPGCAGIRTFYRAGCSKPVPKLNPKFPVNGCGPQNGFNPVPQVPLYIADFSVACDGHDRGYGTCNRPKAVTDNKFLQDMKAICAGGGTASPGLFESLLMIQCISNAEIYYAVVSSKRGDDPYKDGQSEGCDCCDECPGGGSKCNGRCCESGRTCAPTGRCCPPCGPGLTAVPDLREPVCGRHCCTTGATLCPQDKRDSSIRCCPPGWVCYKGGCNHPDVK